MTSASWVSNLREALFRLAESQPSLHGSKEMLGWLAEGERERELLLKILDALMDTNALLREQHWEANAGRKP